MSIEGVKEYISIDFSAMILSSNRHTVLQLERKLQASASAGDGMFIVYIDAFFHVLNDFDV